MTTCLKSRTFSLDDSLWITEPLQAPIACQMRYIKDLDIPSEKFYSLHNSQQFSHPVNFQHNRDLLEMAMKACHPKGFGSEASKEPLFPSGGFFFWEVML